VNVEIALAILLYPGLALALVLALAFGWLAEGRGPARRIGALRLDASGSTALMSILLAALALALLPWPLHPAAGWSWLARLRPLMLWGALEGAFLVPILPALLRPTPLGTRAASRAAQMSAAGRFVLWLAIGVALWSSAGWSTAVLPGRALAALAGLLALPAAIGSGPFGAERSLSAAGAETGLDESTAEMVRFARTLRGAVLLAALIVATLPLALITPWVGLLLIVALFLVIALVLRRIAIALPRMTLPAALRWCWWRALPLAVAGLVYLIIV
jgi:hypothetical protein